MATKRKGVGKPPKKPKRTASLKTWENYDKRVKEYHKRHAQKTADARKKEALIKRYS